MTPSNMDIIAKAGVDAMRTIWIPKYIEIIRDQFIKNKGNGHPGSWDDSIIPNIKEGQVWFEQSSKQVYGTIIIEGPDYIIARSIVIDQGNNHRGILKIRPGQQVWNHKFDGKKKNGDVVHVKQFTRYRRKVRDANHKIMLDEDENPIWQDVDGSRNRKRSSNDLTDLRSKRINRQKENRRQERQYHGYLSFTKETPMPAEMNHEGLAILQNAATIFSSKIQSFLNETQAFIQREVVVAYLKAIGLR